MHNESELRTIRARAQSNSQVINRLVDSIIGKYTQSLNEYIAKVQYLIENSIQLSNEDIERIVLELPVYLYFAAEGLETLGIEGDNAKAIKTESFNKIFLDTEGTIQDKTKTAEMATFSEEMVEVAYTRAYRTLRTQIEKAEHVYTGAKKVLDKRIRELDLHRMDKTYNKEGSTFPYEEREGF